MANQSSLRAFAELQSYCDTLPATAEGRFERLIVSLIFDTGLPRWELGDADLSAIDLAAGCLTIGEAEYQLSAWTLAAVMEWLDGGCSENGRRADRGGHSNHGGHSGKRPRAAG